MSNRALRVGVVVDSADVPAWVAALLQAVEKSRAAHIARVEYAQPASSSTPRGTPFYHRVDRALFPIEEDALRQVALSEALDQVPDTDDPVDIILHLSEKTPSQRDTPFGTWFFQPDLIHGTACLNATAENAQIASAKLFALYRGDLFCIDQTHTALHTYSVGRSNQRLYWTAHAFVPRRLEALQANGPTTFYQRQGRLVESSDPVPTRETSFSPTQLLGRIWRRGLRDWWQSTEWHVHYGPHIENSLPTSFDHFTPLNSAPGTYWADPFPFVYRDQLFLFFEEYDQRKKKGHISAMPFGPSGPSGPPVRVLKTAGHLSYPFIFTYEGTIYMLPESSDQKTVDLYRCRRFPNDWTYDRTLLQDVRAVDTTLCFHDGLWWMFTCIAAHSQSPARDELFLFYADSPLSKRWTPHPLNPIVSDVRHARPAGRIIQYNGHALRPAQDCSQRYGHGLHLREITTWDTVRYEEQTHTSMLPQGLRLGMHTINLQAPWVFVDIKVRKPKRWF